jgi:hypothetical protein
MRRELLVTAFLTGIAVALLVTLVIPFQRMLNLVAAEDVAFYDGKNRERIVFILPAGDSATIIRCEDTKHLIEPVIQLKDGREVHRAHGRMQIQSLGTGVLSRPQYLGCGDY